MREKLHFVTFRKHLVLSGIYFLITKTVLTLKQVGRLYSPSYIFTSFYTNIFIGIKNSIAFLNLQHNYMPTHGTIFPDHLAWNNEHFF